MTANSFYETKIKEQIDEGTAVDEELLALELKHNQGQAYTVTELETMAASYNLLVDVIKTANGYQPNLRSWFKPD